MKSRNYVHLLTGKDTFDKCITPKFISGVYISREDALVHNTTLTETIFRGKITPDGAYIFIVKKRTMCYRESQIVSTIASHVCVLCVF